MVNQAGAGATQSLQSELVKEKQWETLAEQHPSHNKIVFFDLTLQRTEIPSHGSINWLPLPCLKIVQLEYAQLD